MKKKKPDNSEETIRKAIIDFLAKNHTGKYNYKQIAAQVNIFDKEGREKIRKLLESFKNAKLVKLAGRGKYKINPRFISNKSTSHHFVEGTILMNRGCNAFVVPAAGNGDDIFIAESKLGNALHQDKVKIMLYPARNNKRLDGEVVEVIERYKRQLVGIIDVYRGIAYLVSDNPYFRHDVLIPSGLLKQAKKGDKVVASIEDWPAGARSPIGKVIEVLGKPGDNDVEMNAILVDIDFPLHFAPATMKEAEAISTEIPREEIAKRRDFRDILTFTIDPADAKDFDDAISYEQLEDGKHRIGVHIADVSHYVTPNSAIDREAYERGTSVYLVDRTIPMLPEKLSNELCSLRPNEEKLCFSAVFDLDDNAKVCKEWFGKTIINSDYRFDYESAQNVIETQEGMYSAEIGKVHAIAQILRQKRFDNHAINFETEEVKFKLDENSKPIGVYLKVQKEANFLIEEFMLLANRKVAEKIGKVRKGKEAKSFIYRIHDEPLGDKIEQFRNFVKKLGYDFKGHSRKAFTESLTSMFGATKDKNEYNLLSQLSIRMMARAVYATQNIGHFGLAFQHYTHFTSPIRRYPDLLVHRLLFEYLNGEPSKNETALEEISQHCSAREQKATEAERASIKFKQAEYLADKVGQVFDARVSGIAKWGVFAELIESKCEGLIPIKKFDDDFYYIDEDNYTLVGLHKGKNIHFGDLIKVKVMEVDLLKKSMTFVPV